MEILSLIVILFALLMFGIAFSGWASAEEKWVDRQIEQLDFYKRQVEIEHIRLLQKSDSIKDYSNHGHE